MRQLIAAIGHQFQRPELLEMALTHRSFAAEHNERLEFLGDSILNCATAARLYALFPNAREGELSRMRASLVRGDTLAELAIKLDLGRHLKLGEGEIKTGGRERNSILADAFEAVIGALYLDAGFAVAAAFVEQQLAERLQWLTLSTHVKDPKTQLQELLQAAGAARPRYTVLETTGAAHAMQFTVQCSVDAAPPTVATAGNRRAAEKQAAEAMLTQLTERSL